MVLTLGRRSVFAFGEASGQLFAADTEAEESSAENSGWEDRKQRQFVFCAFFAGGSGQTGGAVVRN